MSAESNRQSMPIIAAFVDELRKQGLTPKVIWARESGKELGKRPDWAKDEKK